MYKWTYEKTAQQQQNQNTDDLKIFEKPTKPLYHYTSREVFWKIMNDETFYARHIMFSNDYRENEIGNEKVRTAMESLKMTSQESEAIPFMICFCEKDDLLSQWRGYAMQGIAMEFDFTKGLYGMEEGFSSYYCYTIVNEKEQDADENEAVVEAIASPYSVIYTDDTPKPDRLIEDKIKTILEKTENQLQRALQIIPYIKNNKFEEEKEYRLIFDMNQLVPESKQYLLEKKYRYLETAGVRKPNILVKFKDESAGEHEEIRIYYGDDSLDPVMNKLAEEMKKDKIVIEPVRDSQKYKMEPGEIIVSDGKYQEQVCTKLRLMIYQNGIKDMKKIWCDGHLPIRRIVVGPSQDAELMKNSIKEYLKTKYWTKDIEVEVSKIPLRM